MRTRFGSDDTCASTGASINVPNSNCTSFNGNLGDWFAGTPPAPSGATCSGSAVEDGAQVTSAELRACQVPESCREEVCNGTAPDGFSACIAQDGDTTCPSGWGTRTLVGTGTDLTCTACDCTVTATCTGGTISFFTDASCNDLLIALDVNDSCQDTPGGAIRGYRYTATLNPTCTADGPNTASVELMGPRTVCCK